jgi:GNAT superfamily N-acetyltransferase
MFLLAIETDNIIWMIRWKNGKIINLYVDTNYEWHWIGWALLNEFEAACKTRWIKKILLKSSIYAKDFYLKRWFSETDGQYLEKNIA